MKIFNLDEVCKIVNGGTPDTKNARFWGEKHAWITPAEMGNLINPYLGNSRRKLTDAGLQNSSATLLPVASVIMSSRAPIGHLVINEVPMAFNQGCKGFIPAKNLNFKFLYYFLFNNKKYLNSIGSGTTFVEVSSSKLRDIKIPIPSLNDQQGIVEKLDKAFAEINLLEKNLQLKEEKTDHLLHSMLNAAFTEDQEFEMKRVKLGDICELKGGGTPSKVNEGFYQGEIPWATVRDLKTRWLQVTQHKINFNAVKSSSTNVIPSGTVILATRVGLGKVVQLRQDTAINQDLRALIPKDKSNVLNEFIYYWVLANTSLIIKEGKGATVQGVTLPFLQKLILPFPSLKYQKLIVEKLDKAFAEIEFLKSQLAMEKQMAAALRQSILSNAFNFADKAA